MSQSRSSTNTRSRKSKGKKTPPRAGGGFRRIWRLVIVSGLIVTVAGVGLLDWLVTSKFNGKKWALPARVYARPLELFEGRALKSEVLEQELKALGYRQVGALSAPGQVLQAGTHFSIHSRGFDFWDKHDPAQPFSLTLSGGRVRQLRDSRGDPLELVRLEPREIGGIYPAHGEDRLLVRLSEIPPLMGEALIAVEDRRFLDHFGVSPRAIARAALANIKSGSVVQGGSTLTQQLVKNFYLNQERSLMRKAVEAVMALLLEFHYSKAEILETYINEVYLGQSGSRAVHGFALASVHYFHRPLTELELPQLALLVGLVKGASYYNPWRFPERAKRRRDLVLGVMADEGLISTEQLADAKAQPLGVKDRGGGQLHPYPAYMDLVKRQLMRDYREEDLRSEGLRIFTGLDPWVQARTEESLAKRLQDLEIARGISSNSLQGAAVVVAVGSGEVMAVVGDRNSRFSGFNRALDARRQVGSLIKPAVYLAALSGDQGYTLATPISDGPVTVAGRDGSFWQPSNFSHKNHGEVPLYKALAHSYNQSTARLGMQLGLHRVKHTVEALGVTVDVPQVPSMLLGSVEMSPLEVATMYHTLATEGFYTPLRSIRAVLSADGTPLKRYPLQVEQRFSTEAVYLLNYALQAVMHEGTGRSAYSRLPRELRLAGKTGTTNDQRDSWFSGYSGDHLAVVWLGRDDNGRTPLTGASGALQVWTDLMLQLPTRSMDTTPPLAVRYSYVDIDSGQLSGENCRGAQHLPFIEGQEPMGKAHCEWVENPVVHWWKGLWRK